MNDGKIPFQARLWLEVQIIDGVSPNDQRACASKFARRIANKIGIPIVLQGHPACEDPECIARGYCLSIATPDAIDADALCAESSPGVPN